MTGKCLYNNLKLKLNDELRGIVMRKINHFLATLLLSGVVACGGSGGSKTTPTPTPSNQSPTASAPADFNAAEGSAVSLNGTNSSDSDGTISTYLWEQTSGTPTVTLTSANTATASFTAPDVTSNTALTFRLTVTDNAGATANDVVIVTITPAAVANQSPIASAPADFSVVKESQVSLDGSGSSDPDGTIASYLWEQTAGSTNVTLNAANTATASFTAPIVSSATPLTFKLTVTDNAGATASDSVIVTISPVSPGSDPNFTIVGHSDAGFSTFNRKVVVFGVPIYAVPNVDDNKLLHAANLLAQYLDNNEDGNIDNQQVVDAMHTANAFMVMWKAESDLEGLPNSGTGQDLGNDETHPEWHTNGHTGEFDAAIEEVWHIVTHAGYAKAYPNIFGEMIGSTLANAMDIARGGQFTTIPNPYPEGAWYTYDDTTCEYGCMVTEYVYWAMSSILGAQANRLNEINNEWRLNTKALVQSTDTAVYELLTNTQYKLPTVLPDGTYRR